MGFEIDICDRKLCTGCRACVNSCSSGALTMATDEFGYFKAVINAQACTACGGCVGVCPVLYPVQKENATEPACYAVSMEDSLRALASSGGIFPSLATDMLQQGGYVCGVAWDKTFGVEHIIIQDQSELPKLFKSKYLQSNTGDIYNKIKRLLDEGKRVLFSGCPCQVAALYSVLGKDYVGLYTIDLLCIDTPSQSLFKKYLEELFGNVGVQEYEFRSKRTGWSPDTHRIQLKDGRELIRYFRDDPYQQLFHPRIMMPVHCENCHFAGFPRSGDLSIGDYHGIDAHDPSLNDGKGISLALVNNQKGESLLSALREKALLCQETPLDWVNQHNRVRLEGFEVHPDRDRFYALIRTHSFKQTVLSLQNRTYDIGVVGNWSWRNYGAELTYYALYSVLTQLGYSVLMIGWPRESAWTTYDKPELFGKCPYPDYAMEKVYEHKRDMKALNDRCDIFIQGSDQLFKHYLYHAFGKIVTLDWVYSYKKKIAYAASFGNDVTNTESWGPEYEKAEIAYFLQQFDSVSVREKSALGIMKDHFGVNAEWVLDPVFLCERAVFDNLAQEGVDSLPASNYLFSYMLDPDAEKGNMLKHCANELGLELRVISDGEYSPERVLQQWNTDTLFHVTVEQLVAHIKHADFVITDSFHGVCLCIIFQKSFIAIANPGRGIPRFTSLLELVGLEHRMVESAAGIFGHPELLEQIQYSYVRKILDNQKARCIEWLKKSITAVKHAPLTAFDITDRRYDQLQKNMSDTTTRVDSLEEKVLRMHHLELELENTRQVQAALIGSVSFRLGRTLTWLPRKLRDVIKRVFRLQSSEK